jgi:hypothetical protein
MKTKTRTSFVARHRKDITFTTAGCYPVQLTIYKVTGPAKKFSRVGQLIYRDGVVESRPMLTRAQAAACIRTARRQGAPIHHLG